MDFELASNAFPIGISTDGSIVTPNPNVLFYRMYAENLQVGNGTIGLTVTSSGKQYLFQIQYACLVIEYPKLQFKISSKLYNHHQQYKATFQILNSFISNVPVQVLDYKCTNSDCKLVKINSNSFDIIFYKVPTNYKDNWSLEFGSTGNTKVLSFPSPYKDYSEGDLSNLITPSQSFIGYGQHQVARYYFAYSDTGNPFYIPPAINMVYSVSDVYDIIRKPKVVSKQNQLVSYQGKAVKRLGISSFLIQYDIESNSDLIQFPLNQTNLLIGAVLNEKSVTKIGNIFQVEFTSSKLNYNLRYFNTFVDESIGVEYQLEYNAELPFGLVDINLSNYILSVKVPIPIHSLSNFEAEFDNSFQGGAYYYDTNTNDIPSVNNLSINKIEWFSLDQGYFILRVNVSDSIGLKLLRLTPNSYGNSALTYSSSQNGITTGIYEYKFSYSDSFINLRSSSSDSTLSLSVSNGIIQFEQTIQYNEIMSLLPTMTRFIADPLLEILKDYDIGSNIKMISFLNNEMDVTDKDGWNLMFIEFKDTVQNYEPMMSIVKDVSEESYFDGNFDSGDVSVQYYYGKWSKEYNMYIIEFKVPKNIMPGYLAYSLSVTYNKFSIVYNQDLPLEYQLTIISNKTDYSGPVISNIDINPRQYYGTSGDFDTFGWNITISDSINGLKNGFIVVRGLKDFSLYNFTISKDSIISGGGDIFSGIHQITIITPSGNCGTTGNAASHNFQIFEIYLVDTGDNIAHFKVQGETNKLAFTDPLLYNPALREKIVYEYGCTSIVLNDWYPPSVSSIQVTPGILNVLGPDRKLDIRVEISCPSSVNIYSSPIVYLSALLNKETIKVPLTLLNCTTYMYDYCYYSASIIVPYSFGFPDGIYYSIFGVLNGRSGAFGLSSGDINKFINTSASVSGSPFISSTGQISRNGGTLRVEGFALQNTKSILASFGDGSTQSISPSKVFSTSLMILNIKATKGPFTIKAISNNGEESNIFTVNPITTIEIPVNTNTPKPITCPKDVDGKMCSNNGQCVNNQCICTPPWTGNDCSSQIITIPQPEPSIEEPSTIIIVEQEDVLKSIISVVQLRELDVDSKPIRVYNFSTWERTTLSSSSFQYISTISNNNIDTMINVTLQWFENSTTIEFANEVLEMNPSTLKYTITIGQYSFESKLNTLQLVMLSSVSSNANDCSYKEFGNQTSSDYLKLQIKGKSLYGRYIKRCILDNTKFISISNVILDKDSNLASTNNSNDNNNLYSYIGINIPYYENSALIDPDYSVMTNYNKNENQGELYCGKGGRKKGLSGLNILGICLGGFFAIVGASICYLYIRGKKKKRKQFLEKLRQTELSMRSLSTTTIDPSNHQIDIEKN